MRRLDALPQRQYRLRYLSETRRPLGRTADSAAKRLLHYFSEESIIHLEKIERGDRPHGGKNRCVVALLAAGMLPAPGCGSKGFRKSGARLRAWSPIDGKPLTSGFVRVGGLQERAGPPGTVRIRRRTGRFAPGCFHQTTTAVVTGDPQGDGSRGLRTCRPTRPGSGRAEEQPPVPAAGGLTVTIVMRSSYALQDQLDVGRQRKRPDSSLEETATRVSGWKGASAPKGGKQ